MALAQFFDAASGTYTYVLVDEVSREAVVIDPVDTQTERDLATLQRLDARLVWVLRTHAHAGHVTGAARLAELTGARLAAPAGCAIATARQLRDGDALVFGAEQLRVLHAPGHAAGSVCYHWQRAPQAADAPGDPMRPGPRCHEHHVFTGNALRVQSCERPDLPSGDGGQPHDGITARLFTLPDATIVWPGHDDHGRRQFSIGAEKAANPHLAGRSREGFIALTGAPPRRIDEADVRAADGYAGDISPRTAHGWALAGRAVLVDVRTDAEREWVGFVPGAAAVAWMQWPGMAPNPGFDAAIRAVARDGRPLMLLCRSGVRSIAAARRATELGLTAYNVLEGFEGAPDAHAQRGRVNGWRQAGLPWRQG